MYKVNILKIWVGLSFCLMPVTSFGVVEPDKFQIDYLQQEINISVSTLFNFWTKADYASIYDIYADINSKKQITKLEFVSRMNNKFWIPIFKDYSKTELNLKFIGLSRAFLILDVEFKNRRNIVQKFTRKITFNLTYEELEDKKIWAFDLSNLLRASF